ncbi:S8 family serine peptidase, partial [Melioribacteraceae bacterium 4301-Me]|uniref:S8 family serine peptidase n=1 Tax=Pyranulibacter aquaticus TaxID=3163344 RepID=UPI00359BBBFB
IMKLVIKYLFLLSFISSITFAQLTMVTEPNMNSEAPLYKNEKGELYSTIITFKYGNKLANISKGSSEVQENDILVSEFRNFLNRLKNQYGEFSLLKAVPDAIWGDTLKTNKRTKQIARVVDLSQIYKIDFSKPVPIDSVVNYLKSFPRVLYAEGPIITYTTLTPNDPEYNGDYLWSFHAIKAEQAWDLTTGSSNIRIAINDLFGGVNELHEDLVSKVVWDNLNGNYGGHGIITAGVAGAMTNNNLDIASLGWNCSLLLDNRWGSSSAVASVYDLVNNRGADVINFSWVSGYYNQLEDAISYALQSGIVCVASAGNNEWTIPGLRYPAAYNFGTNGQVIAVSGTQLSNGVEQFIDGFNYSPGTDPINDPTNSFIDFSAPGTNYRALNPDGTTGTVHIWAGTSISAPFVSALVGLMLSVDNSLTPNEIYNILQRTSDRIGQYSYDSNGWNRYLGYGRIDAWDAVNVAGGAPAEVRNLHLITPVNNHPTLQWDLNTEPDIYSYKVYRSYDNSPFYYAATVSHPNNTYVDTWVDYTKPIWEKSVIYYVTAVDNTVKESVPSNQVETTGQMNVPPLIISNDNSTATIYEEPSYNFELIGNYPNPFNPTTNISFSIPEKSFVTLKIYDILGNEVAELVNDYKEKGNYTVRFDGSKISSGTYIYKLTAGNKTFISKMQLVK